MQVRHSQSDLENKITDADKNIPDTSGIVKKKTDHNVKTSVIEGKILSIQIVTEKLVKLKKTILIIIMINTLLL